MHKKKIAAILLILIFAFNGVAYGKTNKISKKLVIQDTFAMAPGAPDIKAKGAVLIDASSGQVLYGLDQNTPLLPASTTKILTGILAIEKLNLNDTITVSAKAAKVEGTRIGLFEGEKVKVSDLIYALLMNSANDAAIALAEKISGDTDNFALLMNEKARKLGAKNSNFVNPNGLPDPNHHTSAYDLAMITRYAMQNPTFRKVVATSSYEIQREKPDAQKNLFNHNKLVQPNSIYRYPGATGVKTGYTIQARQCIVASAKRDGREYIAVVLGAEAIWQEPTKLLNYGFNNFHSIDVNIPGEFVQVISVKNGTEKAELITEKKFSFSLPSGVNTVPSRKVILSTGVEAPVKAGTKLGRVEYYYKGQKIGSVNLVSKNNVKAKKIFKNKSFGMIAFIGGGGLLVLILIGVSFQNKKRPRHRKKVKRMWYLH